MSEESSFNLEELHRDYISDMSIHALCKKHNTNFPAIVRACGDIPVPENHSKRKYYELRQECWQGVPMHKLCAKYNLSEGTVTVYTCGIAKELKRRQREQDWKIRIELERRCESEDFQHFQQSLLRQQQEKIESFGTEALAIGLTIGTLYKVCCKANVTLDSIEALLELFGYTWHEAANALKWYVEHNPEKL